MNANPIDRDERADDHKRIDDAIERADKIAKAEIKELGHLIYAEYVSDSGEVEKGDFLGYQSGGHKEYALTFGKYTASGIFYDGELVDVVDVEGG